MAVLAAGQSRRFGPDDKLTASFRGKRLGEQACHALLGLDFAHRWVIAARADHPCAQSWQADGFTIAVNAQAAAGMGTSVALAAALALEANADGLLIALADMPLVSADHCRALIARAAATGPAAIVASAADGVRSPPAAFGRDHFAALAAITGDVGARVLLRQAELVACAPELLIDIDDEAALNRALQA
ncbi:NTP transferase domain-containing protein [Novosphingobium sp.]|uniref:nucleotidyltransferase family protein n=1 Tax=Novosphingobium sp. TaxID=1874826 RepID=UPI0027372131|nr:NTP transferase domain-containing protein [Novosphingobium sp.]MDP3908563.1 NTP transferase domain-containing protein [Novosphingobium sp.]